MANRIFLTRPTFERLIEHLVFIEENADGLADFYYSDLPTERKNLRQFFIEYVKKIEAELEKVDVVGSIESFKYIERLNEFPFIIIGSQIQLVNPVNNSEISLKMIQPEERSTSKNNSELTYLSTLGKELLLKEVGSEAIITMPTGVQSFIVKSAKLE